MATSQHLQKMGLFGSSYLERLKEGDTAMLVLSGLNSASNSNSFSGNTSQGRLRLTRTRSSRGSRRNLREWSSESENEYGLDEDDMDSALETELSSVRPGSESDDTTQPQPKADTDTQLGVQPTYAQLAKRARRRTAHWHLRDDQAMWLAQQSEELVPIRIELEVGDYRLHDVFVWNANEQIITPEQFASIYCADLSLPATAQQHIAQLIRQQVAEYTVDIDTAANSELRVVINLEVQVGSHMLRDRVEWDILEPVGSKPELFARVLCSDLGLGGEYPPLIAHRVREEIARLRKELVDAGDAQWLKQLPVDAPYRAIDSVDAWGPSIEILSAEDLDRLWVHKERAYRRMRRSERSHMRSFNFLPPEQMPGDPGVAPTVIAPSINPNLYAVEREPTKRTNGVSRVPSVQSVSRSSTPRVHTKVDLSNWKCEHCGIDSSGTPIPRQGPNGPKTLCNACGIGWRSRNRQGLPPNRKDMYRK